MKYSNSIFLLVIVHLLLSTTGKQQRDFIQAKTTQPASDPNSVLKDRHISIYEVRFTYNGYVSFYGDSPDCPVGTGGYVTLTGRLKGDEQVGDADDVDYEGTLLMDMNIGICSAKRNPNGEDVLCNITVSGKGDVVTSLVIYFDGRGGYMKLTDTTSRGFARNVGGTCDTEQTDEERKMVPLKTIASVFNGCDMPAFSNVKTLGELELNKKYEDQWETGKVVFEVLRKVQ